MAPSSLATSAATVPRPVVAERRLKLTRAEMNLIKSVFACADAELDEQNASDRLPFCARLSQLEASHRDEFEVLADKLGVTGTDRLGGIAGRALGIQWPIPEGWLPRS